MPMIEFLFSLANLARARLNSRVSAGGLSPGAHQSASTWSWGPLQLQMSGAVGRRLAFWLRHTGAWLTPFGSRQSVAVGLPRRFGGGFGWGWAIAAVEAAAIRAERIRARIIGSSGGGL